MSWTAYLLRAGCSCGDCGCREWNYTHNCNGMANAVLDPEYVQRPVGVEVIPHLARTPGEYPEHVPWWKQLDGLSGPEGGALLHRIIVGLEADPEGFRAMDPPNGWGGYDSFLEILRDMRAAVPEWPTTWTVHG